MFPSLVWHRWTAGRPTLSSWGPQGSRASYTGLCRVGCTNPSVRSEILSVPHLLLTPLPRMCARQVSSLQLFIGALSRVTCLATENRDSLVHKCAGYSSRLLKKPDQCRAAYLCSHLFWTDEVNKRIRREKTKKQSNLKSVKSIKSIDQINQVSNQINQVGQMSNQ
eukprot:1938022-Pyramimonas_sp.AAC.1